MNLIDRDKIVKVAEHAYNEWNLAMAAADGEREINRTFRMQELCKAVRAVAMSAPVIDAKPVVHGKWVEEPYLLGVTRRCNICGKNYGMPHGVFNFCPNCGASMEEVPRNCEP